MVQSSMQGTQAEPVERWLPRLLGEYAGKPMAAPLDPRLSLREDLAIESLSLVSLVVRLGDKLGVDAADDNLDLAGLHTVGDLVTLAHRLADRSRVTPEVVPGHSER